MTRTTVIPERCDYDVQRETNPEFPMYRAQCRGCAIAGLAAGPLFHMASAGGRLDHPYRRALGMVFGDNWQAGHEEVKAAHARLKLARAVRLAAEGKP